MKTKLFILTALFFAAFSFPAEAQLGGLLNKAKDKVKEAATKEVKKTAEKKAEQVAGTVETSATEASENVQLGVENATATDIDPMLGVSMSALNKSYEKLDYDIYIYSRPEIPGLFYTKSGRETYLEHHPLRQVLTWVMASGAEAPCIVFSYENDKSILPADVIINANFAAFKAFPAKTYPLFMEARMLIRAMEEGKISLDYYNTNWLLAYMLENGQMYFTTSGYVRFGYGLINSFLVGAPSGGREDKDKPKKLVHWQAEEARLMELYKKYVPFENVKNTFINTMVGTIKASKDKNWTHGVYESYKLAIAAEDMRTHPKKVEDQDYKDALASYENLKTNNYPKWEAFIKKEWMEIYAGIKEDMGSRAAQIPNAAISDPKLEAEMIAIAKTIYEDGRVPVKAIIKNPDWTITRNAFGVIIDRFQTAYIIFKMTDGTHRMVDIGFKQLHDGSKYGRTQLRGIGLVNEEVKYGN